jgi:hypothetical protein
MKIAPLKVSDPWYGRISSDATISTRSLKSVPIEATVEMELVELLHEGPQNNYRPYLHMRGEMTDAAPVVELPFGVTALAMRRGAGLNVDVFYDFNPRQLSDLVSKGYFTEDFQVPAEMSGIPWTVPGKADFLIVAPEFSDQPPVVFMSVHDQSELELDENNSGYDLSAYFPDYSVEALEREATAQVDTTPERDGSGLDMFADVVFDETRPFDDLAPRPVAVDDQRAPVPSGVFSRLVSEIAARRKVEPEPEVIEAEPVGVVPGSAEDFYLSRVSPGVDHVLSRESTADLLAEEDGDEVNDTLATDAEAGTEVDVDEAAAVAPASAPEAGFLDLSEPDEDLAPLRMSTGHAHTDTETDAERKAAQRRARIAAELREDEEPATADEDQQSL